MMDQKGYVSIDFEKSVPASENSSIGGDQGGDQAEELRKQLLSALGEKKLVDLRFSEDYFGFTVYKPAP